jgi:hypothetical protein
MATRRMHLVKMIIYIKALKASDSKVRHKIGTADVAGREGGREAPRAKLYPRFVIKKLKS